MKQTRFTPIEACGLKIRETEDGQQSRVVIGKPIVFGVRSTNLTPWSTTRVVYEILERGCITQELINSSDVVYNNNHSNMISDMLGRCRNGKGTLKLALREDHVESSCEYPNTTNANDTLEQIRLGNVFGMSFAFNDGNGDSENGVTYERTNETVDGKEVWLRHVWTIYGLYDVANVTHPAYEQTSVGTRETSEAIDKAIEAQLQRECGGGDKPKENECGGGSDDDKDKRGCGGEETDEEKAAREQAEREANGGETNAEKQAREQRELEERELEERAEMARKTRELRQRAHRIRREIDFESLNY